MRKFKKKTGNKYSKAKLEQDRRASDSYINKMKSQKIQSQKKKLFLKDLIRNKKQFITIIHIVDHSTTNSILIETKMQLSSTR